MSITRFAAAVASLLGAATSYAVTLNPVADTWVQNANFANNAADANVRVKNQNNQLNDRVSFFKFEGATIPVASDVARFSVTISAFTAPTNMTFQLFGIPDGGANEDFDAGALTFDNTGYTDQSVDNNVNDALFAGGAPLATGQIVAANPIGTTVTFSSPALLNFVTANPTTSHLSFALTTSTIADSVFLSFYSAEGATPPALSAFEFVTNFDGIGGTTLNDFTILRNHYLNTGAVNADGDANFDGTVNHEDFFLWRTAFLGGGGSVAALEGLSLPVPEPASSACAVALSVSAIALRRRRRAT
jgi:hypothetical protein